MSGTLPYGRQDVTEEDIESVVAVLRSPWLTQGPKVPEFEAAIAERCEADHAIALNSATSALHVACLALGVGHGDHVWTSPITFVATANCARYCGAEVDFVDVDPHTVNLCPRALAEKLRRARAGRQPLPKVVIAVHFAGRPCEMEALGALAREYGFRLVEDASHAIGARDREAPVGACRHSDVTVFSFHPVKIITTAEGGVAVTEDADLAERMRRLRTHGVHRPPPRALGADEGEWVYRQETLGFNYRMTDLQAALGLSQLGRLERYLARRHELASRYDALLAPLDVETPPPAPAGHSALHLYPVRVGRAGTGAGLRGRVFSELRSRGIGVNVHYIPVHTQPYYRRECQVLDPLENAMAYYERAVTLPLFGTMSLAEQDRVVDALGGALEAGGVKDAA